MQDRSQAEFREALRRNDLLGEVSDEEFDRIVQNMRGTQMFRSAGEWIRREDDPACFMLLLEGDFQLYKRLGNEEIPLRRFTAGDYFGSVPLLLGTDFLASGRALTDCWLFCVEEANFWYMLEHCPRTSRKVFRAAAGALRGLEAAAQGRERTRSLATMAAGLAHQLNNPASAARRASRGLAQATLDMQDAVCSLTTLGLSNEALEALDAKRHEAVDRATIAGLLSPLTQADLEDACASWLEGHGVEDGRALATCLVMAGLGPQWLEEVRTKLPAEAFDAAVHWLEVNVRARLTEQELDGSLHRISDLVETMKAYSFVDRAPEQDVDIHQSLDATLHVLAPQLEGVEVVKSFDRSIPALAGRGSELSQVFTQLVQNAAQHARGRITIGTRRLAEFAIVDIGDDGPGIPEDVQQHMFDPFFSTRTVGQGSGLGLVLVYRIVVNSHGGSIEFESGENGTTFHVYLPLIRDEKQHRGELGVEASVKS